jgi:hypothetical protein
LQLTYSLMHFQKRFVFGSFKVNLWGFKDSKDSKKHKQQKNKKKSRDLGC